MVRRVKTVIENVVADISERFNLLSPEINEVNARCNIHILIESVIVECPFRPVLPVSGKYNVTVFPPGSQYFRLRPFLPCIQIAGKE